MTILSKKKLFIYYIVCFQLCALFHFNGHAQKPAEIPVEVIDENVLDELENSLEVIDQSIEDIDKDGVPNEADLCPNTKGDLKFYGCLAKSDEYIWEYYEYEVYPKRTALEVTPANYETVVDSFISKPAHKEGATFETITQQVVEKEASTRLEAFEGSFLKTEREIVIDELSNKKITITSFEADGPNSVKEVAIPAEYKTISRQEIKTNGTGIEVPAEYKTSTRQVLKTPASVKEVWVPAITKVVKIRKDPEKAFYDEVFTIVEQMPKFPGGDIELLKYFGGNIKYPAEADSMKIQGVVVIGFTIAKDGSIKDLEIIRDIGGGCGEEAIRLARTMPKWIPGTQRGEPVNVAFKLPIRFKLE